jgi:hypothetical protein
MTAGCRKSGSVNRGFQSMTSVSTMRVSGAAFICVALHFTFSLGPTWQLFYSFCCFEGRYGAVSKKDTWPHGLNSVTCVLFFLFRILWRRIMFSSGVLLCVLFLGRALYVLAVDLLVDILCGMLFVVTVHILKR